MPVPEAVRKQGEESERLAQEAGLIPGAQPVDEHGNPVTAAPAAPAATVTPIDPDGQYKQLETQHRNYKASTDQTIHELRQQVSSDKAELAALQSQINELKAKPAPVVTTPATPEDFESGLKAWLALIPKNELDEYTDDYWRTQYIIKTTPVAGQQDFTDTSRLDALENRVNQSEQVQEKTDFDKYLDEMDAAFPNDSWVKMTQGDQWSDFYNTKISPYSEETFGNIVESAKGRDAKKLIKVLTDFQAHLSRLNADGGNVDPLLGQITPDGGAGGSGNVIDEANARVSTFTESQVDKFYKDAATGNKYTPEQYADIEAQIKAAAQAGKIIPG